MEAEAQAQVQAQSGSDWRVTVILSLYLMFAVVTYAWLSWTQPLSPPLFDDTRVQFR